ncbi:MAG: hypothetical protein ACR2LA_03855 [Acidimicrobiales bacterium]
MDELSPALVVLSDPAEVEAEPSVDDPEVFDPGAIEADPPSVAVPEPFSSVTSTPFLSLSSPALRTNRKTAAAMRSRRSRPSSQARPRLRLIDEGLGTGLAAGTGIR